MPDQNNTPMKESSLKILFDCGKILEIFTESVGRAHRLKEQARKMENVVLVDVILYR